MNAPVVARRVRQGGNILLSLALFTALLSFQLSLACFCAGWVLYGVALLLDHSAEPSEPAAPEPAATLSA